jgi:release factor glutamine methyltransferase
LIPRPETELLVEKALELAHEGAAMFADIGTGSGAIAVTLAVDAPQITVYATDVSRGALEVARLNSRKHGVQERVILLCGDLLEPLPDTVDVIVANLPYVTQADLAAVNTHGFEPSLALNGGPDGLNVVRRLAEQVRGRLNPGGSLLLEIGCGQDEEVLRLLRERFPGVAMEMTRDWAGIPRMVAVTLAR